MLRSVSYISARWVALLLGLTLAQLSAAEMVQKISEGQGRVIKIGTETWIINSEGVFRFDSQQNRLTPVEGLPQESHGSARYIPPGSQPMAHYKIDELGGEVWLIKNEQVFRFDRSQDRAIPVDGIPTGTSRPSMSSGKASPVSVASGNYSVVPIGDEVWIETYLGSCFRYDRQSNRGVAVEGLAGAVGCSVILIGNDTWFQASNGLFRFERSTNRAVPVLGLKASQWAARFGISAGQPYGSGDVVNAFITSPKDDLVPFKIGDEMWITSSHGAFRLDRRGNRAFPIAGLDKSVDAVESIGGDVWIISGNDVYRYDLAKHQVVPISGLTGNVVIDNAIKGPGREIRSVGGIAWIERTSESLAKEAQRMQHGDVFPRADLLRLDPKYNRAVSISGISGHIGLMKEVSGEIWIATQNGLFRFDRQKDRAEPVAGISGIVDDIVVGCETEIWIETSEGIFRYDSKNNHISRLEGFPPYSSGSGSRSGLIGLGLGHTWISNGSVWVSRPSGVFRFDCRDNRALKVMDETEDGSYDVFPATVYPIDENEVWIGQLVGLYRWRRDWKIMTDVTVGRIPLLRVAGYPLWRAGNVGVSVEYPVVTGPPESTDVIVAGSSDELLQKENDKNRKHWLDVADLKYEVTSRIGISELHVSLRDSWGNQIHDRVIRGLVLPAWRTVTILCGALFLSFLIACLCLAPYVHWCHLLLMNPFIRRYASFGIIPIVLTILPAARRHLLKRYRRNVAFDPILNESLEDYVVPGESFEASRFPRKLYFRGSICIFMQGNLELASLYSCPTWSVSALPTAQRAHPRQLSLTLVLFRGTKLKKRFLPS